MSDVILMSSISIDGYIAGPNRELDWHRVDDELHRHLNEVLAPSGAFLAGRRTHELMAAFWPTGDTDPSSTAPMVEFAGIWRDMPKVVYSRTYDDARWNTTIVRDVVPDEVRRLKAEFAGDLILSGAEISREFLRLGLVDGLRVYVHPVVIGRGIPLFEPSDAHLDLSLVESRSFGNGVVLLRYTRERGD